MGRNGFVCARVGALDRKFAFRLNGTASAKDALSDEGVLDYGDDSLHGKPQRV
jgi:hypothetical protein